MTNSRVTSIIKKYIQIVKDAGIQVDQVILFGSQAKGTAHTYSDIDMCIVSKDFGVNRYDDQVTLMRLTDKETIDIEPHPLRPEDLQDRYNPLAAQIRATGIRIL